MLILGIETSCDETAAAVVRHGRRVLSNVIASQHDLHAEFGGVVPEIASRAHVERILPVVRKALADAGVAWRDIHAVAVGHRPGLIGSLLVGVAAARALAWSLEIPLIGVDHIHAHVYSGLLESASTREAEPERLIPGSERRLEYAFPALALVVSGGHTILYRADSPLALTRLGSTIDDAIGEAYDKVAAILGLAHPGGPRLDELAQTGNERAHDFPISRLSPDSLDFSFSGLKTAVLYRVRGYPGMENPPGPLSDRQRADIAASFQRAAAGAVMLKLERAWSRLRDEGSQPKAILVGGGVSANSRLRRELAQFADRHSLALVLPPMEFCMDNAAMIAGLAFHRLKAGERDDLTLSAEATTA